MSVHHPYNSIPCKVYRAENAIMPRMEKDSAGYDLFSPVEITIAPGECVTINTGIRIQLGANVCGRILPKSSLSLPGKELLINGGLIDPGYTGFIHVIVTNMNRSSAMKIEARQKIAQLVIFPFYALNFEIVASPDEFDATHRGSGGFGSTGQF